MVVESRKIKQIMADVFGININNITNDASVDSIEEWDSLNHLKLILALEDELNISFSEEETVEIMSYLILVEILKNYKIGIL